MGEIVVGIQEVCFQWKANQSPVFNIDKIAINKGESHFIKGPSGSGKTTLLHLISGVLVPSSGTVKVLGTNISGLGSAERDSFRADHFGIVFQMFNLIPYLTLVENVILPCSFSKERQRKALRNEASLKSEARRLLSQLKLDHENLEKRPVCQLSIGEQQRVAVARALIGSPEIIICDEPTSFLDTDARKLFIDLLFMEVARVGATLVFVSHDSGLAGSFDRTIKMSHTSRWGV